MSNQEDLNKKLVKQLTFLTNRLSQVEELLKSQPNKQNSSVQISRKRLYVQIKLKQTNVSALLRNLSATITQCLDDLPENFCLNVIKTTTSGQNFLIIFIFR